MKALTLTQPWATLVASGAKRIETRSWSTKYRGPIAIHAAKGFPREAREVCRHNPVRAALERAGVAFVSAPVRHWYHTPEPYRLRDTNNLPLGAIVATATLLEIYFTGDSLNYRDQTRWIHLAGDRTFEITPAELAFGDYTPGRYMWLLDDVRRLPTPIPCKGALGLWMAPELFQESR